MPKTKRAGGVSWLWPSSKPCFEHRFLVRACALSRNSVGHARTFEESKSRRKLADRKLVYALKRPRREAQKKTQTTNHDHKKNKKKQLPITTTKKIKKAQTTNHDQKTQKKTHKLPITTTKTTEKKAQLPTTTKKTQKNTQKTQTHTHKLPITTTKKHKTSTNYKSPPQRKHKTTQTVKHDCTRQNFRICNLNGKLLSKNG